MARVTVEDCLDKVENRFALVIKAAERAHLLEMGAADPLVPGIMINLLSLPCAKSPLGLISENAPLRTEHANNDNLSGTACGESMRSDS